MDIGTIAEINKEAIFVLFTVATPPLLVSLIVGLIVSIFQTLTQIQENTLTFVPKIISSLVTLIISGEYIFSKLSVFVDHVVDIMIHS